jgi:hypothetical protein
LQQSSHPDREAIAADLVKHAGVQEPSAGETVVGGDKGGKDGSKPLRLLIAGAPCSGKGTQCELITAAFPVVHISTGDLLRAEVDQKTPLGQKAQQYMEAGHLIPDEMIIDLVKAKVNTEEVKRRGFLLDGQ